ncbi:AMP-binding protein [Streptomyces sp. NRRL B-24720]|uniref:AMP-binding protein n=1 Tax=Streptomyces sp. NRRL B-24720 TaxID=1476876 RepID=UPI0004C84B22|nr:AMP-binding protein [Streptomyces sp. NRRL B-24720]
MPGADFMVVDFTTGEPLPLGEADEIVVHGPSVLTRYWKSTEATAAVPRDGRPHTGDIGCLDEKVTGIELLDSS